MSSPQHLAVLLLGLAPAGIALAPSEAATEPSGDVGCKIRALPSAGGVRLEGLARAKSAISGLYELIVTTAGGASNTIRRGAFEVRPGEESPLGEVSLRLEERAFYTAMLKLEWADISAQRGSAARV